VPPTSGPEPTPPSAKESKAPSVSPSELPSELPSASPSEFPSESSMAAPFGKVKGIVFWDKNGDGMQEPNEPGIPNVDVTVTDNKGMFQTVTSNDSGLYMAIVPVGPAVMDIIDTTLPEGSLQTAGTDPTRLSIPDGGTATNSDDLDLPTGKVEGIVFEDKNGNRVSKRSKRKWI
jgi:hypothetical protein